MISVGRGRCEGEIVLDINVCFYEKLARTEGTVLYRNHRKNITGT